MAPLAASRCAPLEVELAREQKEERRAVVDTARRLSRAKDIAHARRCHRGDREAHAGRADSIGEDAAGIARQLEETE